MFRSRVTGLFLIASILITALLAACQPQVVEVTRVIEQVQEVTRVVTQTEIVEGEPVEVTRIVSETVEVEVPAEAAEPVVLDVGVIAPRLASLPLLVAAEDYLAPEGIVIRWHYFQSDGAIAQAFASGAIDMSVSNPLRAAQLNDAGADVRIFSVVWGTLDWLFVAKEEIQTLEELSGRTVAISSPGSTTDLMLQELLAKRDMSLEGNNVSIAAIGGTSARAGALAAGTVDAAWIGFDAAYSLLEEQEGFHVLEDISLAREFPGYFSISWTANKEYIDENPDVIRAITRAQIQASRWAQDRDAYVERANSSIVSFISEQSEEQILWSVDRFIEVGMFPVNGGITPEAVQTTMEIGVASESIEEVPAFDEVATDQFQQEVLDELGEWEAQQ